MSFKSSIEWISIHKGLIVTGLTKRNKESLRQKVREIARLFFTSQEFDHFEALHQKVKTLIEQKTRLRSRRVGMEIHYDGLTDSENYISYQFYRRTYLTLLQFEAYLQTTAMVEKRVEKSAFYIAKFPVTYQEYTDYISQTRAEQPSYLESYKTVSQHPFVSSLGTAQHFCEAIGARLPTADEWEYAARGGDDRLYPWGDDWHPEFANVTYETVKRFGSRSTDTTPVDTFPQGVSPFGVWDMIGNVGEWTSTALENFNNTKQAYYLTKAQAIEMETIREPEWLNNIIPYEFPHHPSLQPQDPSDKIGFRPVKDHWNTQVWPGFTPEHDRATGE